MVTALAAGAAIAAVIVLLQSGGLFHYWFGLDFYYLVPPLVVSGLLVLASRLMLLPMVRAAGVRLPVLSKPIGWGPVPDRPWMDIVLPAVRRLTSDLGWLVLLTTVFQFLALLPGTITAEFARPDLSSLQPYATVFDRMALWAVVVAVPLMALRVIAEVWPLVGSILRFPHTQVIGLGAVYVLFAGAGVIATALQFSDSRVLLGIVAAISIFYCGSTLRRLDLSNVAERHAKRVRALVVLMEIAWIAVVIRTLAILPDALATIPADKYRPELEFMAPYPGVLDGLTFWSLVILVPLVIIRSAGVFWPRVDRIAGLPVWRLMLLAAAYVAFARNGILTVIFEFDASQVHLYLSLALVASYAASLLHNYSSEQGLRRLALPMAGLAMVLAAAAPTLAAWAVLSHMPVVSAGLMEYELTRSFGEDYLPHLGTVYDLRVLMAWLSFVLALSAVFTMPSAAKALGRLRPLLAAISLSAAAYLLWLCGSSLSELGHGYVLVGVVAAVGLFSLSLVELAGFTATSTHPIIADVAGWFAASRTRVVVLGGSVAFYGLLLRPSLYETLWFAQLYEYLGLLVLLVLILLRIRRQVGEGSTVGEVRQDVWMDWSHHRQEFETKADPRSELMSSLRSRFVDRGDWRPLWSYLLGLMLRSEASVESISEACRPLRGSSRLDYRGWSLVSSRFRGSARREAAMAESLTLVQEALSGPAQTYQRIDERTLLLSGAPYVEGDDGPETLAVMLMLAEWQQGEELDEAVQAWLHLIGPSALPIQRWAPSRMRAQVTARTRARRRATVENAARRVFEGREQVRGLRPDLGPPGNLMAAT